MKPGTIAGIALWTYSRELCRFSGREMLDTMLDVSNGSTWMLTRESLALVRAGLSVRARIAAEAGGRRILAYAVARAATIWALMSLLSTLRLVAGSDWQPEMGKSAASCWLGWRLRLRSYDMTASLAYAGLRG
jgi:hypothetical protein